MTPNKTLLALCTLAAAFVLAPHDADAAGRVKARGAVQNAEGGITAELLRVMDALRR